MIINIGDILVCKKSHADIKFGNRIVVDGFLNYSRNIAVINGYWFYRLPNMMNIETVWYDEIFVNISERKRKLEYLNERNFINW